MEQRLLPLCTHLHTTTSPPHLSVTPEFLHHVLPYRWIISLNVVNDFSKLGLLFFRAPATLFPHQWKQSYKNSSQEHLEGIRRKCRVHRTCMTSLGRGMNGLTFDFISNLIAWTIIHQAADVIFYHLRIP